MAVGDIRAGGAFVELYSVDKKLVNGLRAVSKRLDAFAKKCFAVAKQAALNLAIIGTPLVLAAKQFMTFVVLFVQTFDKLFQVLALTATSLIVTTAAGTVFGAILSVLSSRFILLANIIGLTGTALRGLIGIFAGLTAAILGAVQAVSRTHTGGAGIPTGNYTNTLVRIKNNTGQVLERHSIGV
ncbi:MAG: hypothetical protein FWE67_05485 [Planctomycetaceae bacterium]|nr:hypothetical protein [Planctomycetaceae bacterium]